MFQCLGGYHIMSDYNWCHGPECHKRKTQDKNKRCQRFKGFKDQKDFSKSIGYPKGIWTYIFASNGCWNDFMHEHWEEFA